MRLFRGILVPSARLRIRERDLCRLENRERGIALENIPRRQSDRRQERRGTPWFFLDEGRRQSRAAGLPRHDLALPAQLDDLQDAKVELLDHAFLALRQDLAEAFGLFFDVLFLLCDEVARVDYVVTFLEVQFEDAAAT